MAAEVSDGSDNRRAITACVILATLMQALDTTIANVALPYIQGSVSATQDQIGWVLTSYIAVAAIMNFIVVALALFSTLITFGASSSAWDL